MTQPYEKYELWQNAFQGRLDDEPSRRLATAYSKAWQHGCSIAKRIASDAAGLTLHDEAHFLSLWKCASLVAGPGVKLSPIEAFILGVAILIHDAAHTVIAYEGGMAAIESTPEWQDALSARLPRDDDGPLPAASSLSEQLRREALFDTVRTLHASQATKLLQVPFKPSGFDANFYIIEDPSLRHHFGELIGKIAASHHWNLSRLEALGRTTNAVSPFDEFGPIRPILLAALLRTADAIQIDSSRAPDFEFALSDPKGVSRDHWSAQSKIATGADAFDGSALVVSSTKSFGDDDIAAWWVAYDLARNADKELREVDVFLHDHRLDRFKLTHVKDISSPSKFSEHVKPNGWVPINAEVKVTNTAKLIEVFGGRELYGNDEVVPLRELIQNAVDAVRARRLLTPSYRGRVVVSLMQEPDISGKLVNWLRVSDDGIGMSMSVLTGPFMTFGETGWASSQLRSERPGFVGKRFRPIGRYGIGFFSVFMIGNEIKVSTKPFESGADHFKTLHFREGVALRPIVKSDTVALDDPGTNTTVQVAVDAGWVRKVLRRSEPTTVREVGKIPYKKPGEKFTLNQLVGVICPALDVEIKTLDARTNTRGVIPETWESENATAWINRIHGGSDLPSIVMENLDLLEPIKVGSRTVARMMVSPLKMSHGIVGVSGFADKPRHGVETVTHFIGYRGASPSGPTRRSGLFEGKADLATWATRQVQRWAAKPIPDDERNAVAANASHHGGDPYLLANAKIDGKWHTLEEIFNRLNDGAELIAPIKPSGPKGPWSIMGWVNDFGGRLYDADDLDVQVSNLLLAGSTADVTAYWVVPSLEDPADFSFLGALDRYCEGRGKDLGFSLNHFDFGQYTGPTIKRERRTNGDRLLLPGLKLRFVDEMID